MTRTLATFPLGSPLPAHQRGGDARARDLGQGRDVRGPHVFATTTHCRLTNGMLRVDVGPAGGAPTVAISAYRGAVTIDDTYSEVYSDSYSGTLSTPAWFDMGVVTLDSPSAFTPVVLSRVELVRNTAEVVIARLVAPNAHTIFLTLRRGEPMVRIQHGDNRGQTITTTRRARWTATTAPVGTAFAGRVEETVAATQTLHRFLASADAAAVNASTFTLTTSALRSATFVAGVGSGRPRSTPADLHHQLAGVALRRAIQLEPA